MKNVMTKERYQQIVMLIKVSGTTINTETGVVTGPRGGHGYFNNKGYLQMKIYVSGKAYQVAQHQLVAVKGFGERCIGYQVDHINNRHASQYDNRLDNLDLLTPSENLEKMVRESLPSRTYPQKKRVVTKDKQGNTNTYYGVKAFCRAFGVSFTGLQHSIEHCNGYLATLGVWVKIE
jgi:hypothetical protein